MVLPFAARAPAGSASNPGVRSHAWRPPNARPVYPLALSLPHAVPAQGPRAGQTVRVTGSTLKVWDAAALLAQRPLLTVHDMLKHLQLEDGRLFLWRVADDAVVLMVRPPPRGREGGVCVDVCGCMGGRGEGGPRRRRSVLRVGLGGGRWQVVPATPRHAPHACR